VIAKAVAEWKANKNNRSEMEQMRRYKRDNDPDRNIYIMDDESDDEPDVVVGGNSVFDEN
jgi:hypothetical protein